MEDIRTVTRLITRGCFMATVDLKDAYFFVAVNEVSKRFLRFKFQGITYEFQCLPFGLSSAPLVFTKLLKPIAAYLRSKGFIIAIYLDDVICIGNTYKDCLICVTETMKLLVSLGFVINFAKSKLIPDNVQTYLGFELNSKTMCLCLPQTKRQKIKDYVSKVRQKTSLSIRDFAKLIGILCSACPAIAYGWVYTKPFEREKFLALQKSKENYDSHMQLSPHLQPDFSWWT